MYSYESMLATYHYKLIANIEVFFMFPVSSESTGEMLNIRGLVVHQLRGTKHGIVYLLMVCESSVSNCLTTNNFIISGVYTERFISEISNEAFQQYSLYISTCA